MSVATARTVSLQGAVGHVVDVQVDVSQGIVAMVLVGRPDASINEGRDRCRTAIANSGYEWPSTRRVTILLSPADLPKRGPHFDLAMAVGVVAATTEGFPLESLERTVLIGELTLDGRLRPVPGVLPMTMAAAARGIDRVFVPEPQLPEAAMVPGMSVFGMRSLGQVVAELCGSEVPDAPPVEPLSGSPLLSWRGEERLSDLDLSDVDGMEDARFALEVAAAGGHHLMLSGPKGAGKTTLAERLPGILPDLTLEESLELTAIHSLAGVLDPGSGLITRPPFVAPHHNASRNSILGGGSGRVRPGEVSRAHCGVLFLDEFGLFATDIIEGLRQPLENGEVTIARGDETATYPTRGMFVVASNPCPCGDYHPHNRDNRCTCRERQRREYRAKLSGPIVDRIDITRNVTPVRHGARDPLGNESSEAVRARVAAARERQASRYAGMPWRLNSQAPGPTLQQEWPMSDDGQSLVDEHLLSGELTRRGATRVHRLAWTVADLAGRARPSRADARTALELRLGRPLLASALDRRAG